MPNSQVPDVRVRLSAEGVQDIVSAFNKIHDAAAHKDGGGVSLMSDAMKDLEGALPTLSIAAAVAGFVALEKAALDSADGIIKLSEKTGTSTEMLSVFAFAARAAGVSNEDLGQDLIHLASSMDQAANGSSKQADAFRRLGISMKQVQSSDPGQMLKLMADKLSKVQDGSQKAAIAQTLLGRQGAQLIPVLNSLANQGYDQVAEKARRMGLVLDDDARAAIEKANNALADMKNLIVGVGMQFVEGFAPQAADAIEAFVNEIDQQGVGGLKKVGNFFGEVFKGIVFVFVSAGQIIGTNFGVMTNLAMTFFDDVVTGAKAAGLALQQIANGGFKAAFQTMASAGESMSNQSAGALLNAKKQFEDLFSRLKAGFASITAPASDPSKHKPPDDSEAKAAARLDLLKAAIQNELALENTRNTIESQQNDRDYADGLISLTDYYNKRRALIQQAAADEIAALQRQQKAILESDPSGALPGLAATVKRTGKVPQSATPQQIKDLQQLAALQNQIDQKRLQVQGQIKANDDQEANAKQKNAVDDLNMQQKIAEMEGDRAKAMRLALQAQILQEQDLLTKHQKELGLTAQEIAQITAEMRAIGEAKNAFALASQQGTLALDDLKLATADIQRLQSTGAINELQASAQIIQLEKSRLDDLRAIGQQLTANAEKSKDPQLIEQAKQYNSQIADLAASIDVFAKAMSDLKSGALNNTKQAFDTFFTDVLSGSKSASDAWKDLAQSFRQVVAQMIAKLIELYFWMLLLKFIAPAASSGSGGGNAPDLTNNFDLGNNGSPSFFGSGGFTGMGATNAIAGFVHGQEYVFDAPSVKAIGVDLLDAMRVGAFRPVPVRSLSSFAMPSAAVTQSASSGVGGSGSGSLVELNIDTQGQPAQATKSQVNGRELINVVIGEVAADIRKGGQAGQAVQQTFGVRRRGVTRG